VPRDPDEFFPVPLNIDIDMDMATGDTSTNEGSTPIPALPGIKVVAKEGAKRYENSVRRLNFPFCCTPFSLGGMGYTSCLLGASSRQIS
jgi:hypothetical protein